MKVLMFYQIILFTDCLMTFISYMHTHYLISIHVLPEDTSLNDLLHTSQTNEHSLFWIHCFTRILHWLKALSHTSQKLSVECKTYYTLHTHTIAHHYVLIIHQTTLLIEGFLTYTIIHNYVRFDVLSDWSFDWMTYCTLHMHMGAHRYVCVDVLSDCSVDWMIYYTPHTQKGAHRYVGVYVLSDWSFD